MNQEKCLDCGCFVSADMPRCPSCGRKIADDRFGDRRGLQDRRQGRDDCPGPERRRRQRRKSSDRRRFAY